MIVRVLSLALLLALAAASAKAAPVLTCSQPANGPIEIDFGSKVVRWGARDARLIHFSADLRAAHFVISNPDRAEKTFDIRNGEIVDDQGHVTGRCTLQ